MSKSVFGERRLLQKVPVSAGIVEVAFGANLSISLPVLETNEVAAAYAAKVLIDLG